MPTITFEIEGSKYSVDVNTVDPNRLYRSFDKVINAVNDAGWEFTSEAAQPDYDELSNIGRTSDGSDINLGDISSRVRQASTSDGEGDVIVTVKGPNGRSERFGLGAKQNLGSLKAKISEQWNLDLSERVELYQDGDHTKTIEGKTDATSVDGQTIYFDTLE
jgi:hypothetical protein